jgi:putative ABC transport system ATP-binding protein
VIIRLLQRAAKEHGAAVICVTHDPRLSATCDRTLTLVDGRLVEDGG